MGEFALIDHIRRRLRGRGRDVLVDVGDDAAAVRPPEGPLLVTTDAMVESVHFDLRWIRPGELGRRLAAANLSDIGAMGGRPRWATLAASLPRDFARADFEALLEGVAGRLEEEGAALVGGDLTGSPGPWTLSLTLMGEAPAAGPLRRDGAQPGDTVWLAGRVGDSALALRAFVDGERPRDEQRRAVPYRAFLDPEPPCRFGAALGEDGVATAAIDVSDGLAQDLGHICQMSGVGARVELRVLPLSAAVTAHDDRWRLALAGGEDWALLFTAPSSREADVLALHAVHGGGCSLAAIGAIERTEGAGEPAEGPDGESAVRFTEDGAPWELPGGRAGWDHFDGKTKS